MPVHHHEAVEPVRTEVGYEDVPDPNGCLDKVGEPGVKLYVVVGAPGGDGAPPCVVLQQQHPPATEQNPILQQPRRC